MTVDESVFRPANKTALSQSDERVEQVAPYHHNDFLAAD